MSQRTLVVQLTPARGKELRARLAAGPFEFRPVPHAVFSAKGEGVVATYYNSGKFVVQGVAPEVFLAHYADIEAPDEPAAAQASELNSVEALIGSDECGKGDYFGPLIVAAVRLEAADLAKLQGSSVRDSKTLSDDQCLRLGAGLRAMFPHAIARLDPPHYNATYQRAGQLNDMLGDLHAQAIGELARPGIHVLIDQFANAALMQKKLRSLEVVLEQRPRAESNPAVAAASIIAREQFLLGLKQLSDDAAIDLHKGAGPPVDVAARRYVALHGRDALSKVAKLHFKNTQKIGPDRGPDERDPLQ